MTTDIVAALEQLADDPAIPAAMRVAAARSAELIANVPPPAIMPNKERKK